jgi:hypothetical protein
MSEITKLKLFSFLILVITLTAILAENLTTLELKPGIPLPEMGGKNSIEGDQLPPVEYGILPMITLIKAIFAIFFISCVLFTIFHILKRTKWNGKTILKAFLFIGIASLAVGVILFLITRPVGSSPSDEMYAPAQAPYVAGPPLGAVPPLLIWIAWIGVFVAVVLFLAWLFYGRRDSMRERDPIQLVVEEAVLAITQGQDFKNAILRCYQQMSLVLKKEQEIEFEIAMTAREFEVSLGERGFPVEPVHQLTSLFEFVRYGNESPTGEEEKRAVICLETIVQFCRERKQQK